MALPSLNLVSLVVVDKRTKMLAIRRDFEYVKSAYGYSVLWLKDKILKINHSDSVSKVRKNPF